MHFKKIIAGVSLLALAGSIFTGCKPFEFEPQALASFSVTNAVAGSPTVDVLVDKDVTSPSRLGFGNTTVSVAGASTIYLPVFAGSHNIIVSADTGKTNIASMTGTFETGKIYSYFVYDTVVSGKAKMFRVTDDLSLPTAGNAKVRYFNLAPNAGPVDVTFVRGTYFDSSSTSTVKLAFIPVDSVTISNRVYPGNAAAVDGAFTTIPASSGAATVKQLTVGAVPAANQKNRYVIRVKQAGTQNILVTSAVTTTPLSGGIYTYYGKGTAQSQAHTISSMINFY
jgi:hypothetical protein